MPKIQLKIEPTMRPTKYRTEMCEQVAKLCALGATDMEIADFFSVPRSEDEFLAFALETIRRDPTGVIAARKKARSEMRRRDAAKPSWRIRNAMQARIWAALKGRSDGALFSRLGYTLGELMNHLERKFQEGMSWANYGRWHVDHIRPCASFNQTDAAQFAECWALANLQPLWASENSKKGARIGPA